MSTISTAFNLGTEATGKGVQGKSSVAALTNEELPVEIGAVKRGYVYRRVLDVMIVDRFTEMQQADGSFARLPEKNAPTFEQFEYWVSKELARAGTATE